MHLAGRAVHHVGDLWMKLEPRRSFSSCSLHRGAIRTMPPGCPGRPPRITTPRHRVKGRVPSGLGQLAGRLRRAAPADTPQALHAFHPRAHVHGVDFGLVERARIWIAASWRAQIQMATQEIEGFKHRKATETATLLAHLECAIADSGPPHLRRCPPAGRRARTPPGSPAPS